MLIDKSFTAELKPKEERTFYFYYKDIKMAEKIVSSCNCTNVKNEPRNSRFALTYKAAEIPVHLKEAGEYTSSPYAEITYIDDKDERQVETIGVTITVKQ